MKFKDKNDDIASKDFSRVLNRMIREAKSGNSGLIVASTYTLNMQSQNMLRFGLSSLYNAMKRLTPSIVSLWLLPPPTHFKSYYRKQHIQGILDLLKIGTFLWFDPAVHAKFLLFWSSNKGRLINHCRYFGSTNFTVNGLIKNIEEFHCDLHSQIYTAHSFYFQKAMKYLASVINLYEKEEYWESWKILINKELKNAISEIRTKAADAKRPAEKLEVARIAYFHTSEILTRFWNLPGKKWAYEITEAFSISLESPWFEIGFLEEILEWPEQVLDEFIRKWDVDADSYLNIALKLQNFLQQIESRVSDYFETGYEAFLFDEEQIFKNQINIKKDFVLTLKDIRESYKFHEFR